MPARSTIGADTKTNMTETNAGAACPICASPETFPLAEASHVPILMNRLYATAAAARTAPSGALRLTRCAHCGFTWNRDFRAELIVYDEAYENDQTFSGVFQAHVERLAADVIEAAEPLRYLEVGCGQGGFLGLVAERAGSAARLRRRLRSRLARRRRRRPARRPHPQILFHPRFTRKRSPMRRT